MGLKKDAKNCSKSEIIIFGASLKGRAALDITNYIGEYYVYAFADNSPQKQKDGFMGFNVLSAEDAVASGRPILLASMFKYEIIEQLKGMDCSNYFFSYRDKGIELPESMIKELEEITSYVHYYSLYEILYDFEVPEHHSGAAAEKGKVVLCCDTIYQFFTCIVLKKLYLESKSCILLAGNRINPITAAIKNVPDGIFDRIIHFNFNYNMTKSEYDEIVEAFGVPEKFIFFTDYYILTKRLLRTLPKNTTSIMSDEGVYFYTGIAESQRANKMFDRIRVDEFWGYNENLFVTPKSEIPFHKIQLGKRELKEIITVLNKIFCYIHKPLECDIIYFDASLKGYASADENTDFIRMIDKILIKYNGLIKPHPSEDDSKYSELETKVIWSDKDTGHFPWELYELNNILYSKKSLPVYISILSTASVFSYIFADISDKNKNKIIFVYDILSVFIKKNILNDASVESFISRIDDGNIFIPQSFEELEDLLSALLTKR